MAKTEMKTRYWYISLHDKWVVGASWETPVRGNMVCYVIVQ